MAPKLETEIFGVKDDWYAALNAMLGGDPQPFAEIYSHADEVAYLSTNGSMQVGWENTWKNWQQQARESHGVLSKRLRVIFIWPETPP